MSKLYEQAIADSKKLKEVLRQEVETDVLKKYKPYIEKMVEQEIEGFLFEQDEPESLDLGASQEQPPTDSAEKSEIPAEKSAEPVDTSFSAPITPVGGNATMPIPDADGKVIVSFESLFSSPSGLPQPTQTPVQAPESTPPLETPEVGSAEIPPAQPEEKVGVTPVEQPAPTETVPETQPAEKFNPEKLQEARDKIGVLENEYANMFISKKIGLKEVSDFSYKLLETYSELENMKDLKEIRETSFDVLSLKMENLYKLIQNSEKLYNSYHRTQKITEGNHIMKVHPKTRSFLNGLLESLETGFGDDGTVEKVSEPLDALDKAADKAGKGAAAASKPKLEDPERGKQAPFKHKAKEDESLLKEDATEEVESSDSDSSLDEEIAALEKEMDEMLGAGESSVMESKKVSKKDDKAAKKAKKVEAFKKVKKLKEQLAAAQKEMDECGGMEGSSGQTTITITTDGKVDGADSDMGSKVDLVDSDGDEDDMTLSSGDEDLNEEDMFEIVMDEDESMDEDWDMDETKTPEETPSSLQESKQVKSLKEYAKELETVAARSLYINRVFANYDGLSKKQKELVVEYIDRAKNPEDAKRIYGRIKKQLSEAKAEAAKKTEKKTDSLNESVSRKPVKPGTAADKIVIGSADRFRELVANKKNG